MKRNSQSGVVILVLALVAALVVMALAFVRSYQAHQQSSAQPVNTLYNR
jgi:hypothetical protein